jgi:hypothetical protein
MRVRLRVRYISMQAISETVQGGYGCSVLARPNKEPSNMFMRTSRYFRG